MDITKKPYEAPQLVVLGSFEEMTQATKSGANADQTIPAGTPIAGKLS